MPILLLYLTMLSFLSFNISIVGRSVQQLLIGQNSGRYPKYPETNLQPNLTMRLPKLKPQITLYVGAISFAFLKDCFEDFYSLLILYSESIRS
jgi:hypothetical protein